MIGVSPTSARHLEKESAGAGGCRHVAFPVAGDRSDRAELARRRSRLGPRRLPLGPLLGGDHRVGIDGDEAAAQREPMRAFGCEEHVGSFGPHRFRDQHRVLESRDDRHPAGREILAPHDGGVVLDGPVRSQGAPGSGVEARVVLEGAHRLQHRLQSRATALENLPPAVRRLADARKRLGRDLVAVDSHPAVNQHRRFAARRETNRPSPRLPIEKPEVSTGREASEPRLTLPLARSYLPRPMSRQPAQAIDRADDGPSGAEPPAFSALEAKERIRLREAMRLRRSVDHFARAWYGAILSLILTGLATKLFLDSAHLPVPKLSLAAVVLSGGRLGRLVFRLGESPLRSRRSARAENAMLVRLQDLDERSPKPPELF